MLKERKLRHDYIAWNDYYGSCKIEGFDGYIYGDIRDNNIIKEINGEEYYFAEVKTSASDSDYHSYYETYEFEGVFLNFNLNDIDTVKYFGEDLSDELFPKEEIINIVEGMLKERGVIEKHTRHRDVYDVDIKFGCLKVTLPNRKLDNDTLDICNDILQKIRNYYSNKGVHITRMFGSYILLQKIDGKLKAVEATPIPIKYCPLMVKLLTEVGGEHAKDILESLKTNDTELQTKMMCKLINEVVIAGGYFDTDRPLNSCEANVLFGASETMSSAFKSNIIDAAVIVSNNLGTIITTDDSSTQGAVKRMTGLFYTSPSKTIVDTALDANIIPVFPYTASIDQLEGVKKAIELGYKNIAVSVAANDNYLHEQLKELEKDGVKIYKFGLCSTGINESTAEIMKKHADVVWSCASKYVKSHIAPNAVAQVGIKIPVHIMTEDGWNIVSNHLKYMDKNFNPVDIKLSSGNDEPVILNSNGVMKKLSKKDLKHCSDCPNPCV